MGESIAQDGPSDEYLIALGRITMEWAIVEDPIDTICQFVFSDLGGKPTFPRDGLPRSLDRKAAYLRKCFKKLPRLSVWTKEATRLLNDLQNLKGERHRLVHGAPAGLEADGGVKLIKWRYAAERFHTEHSTAKAKQLDQLHVKMHALAIGWLNLAMAICYEVNPSFFDKAGGEVPRKLT